jgi:YspA, cpYpsA-related SLOG family
MIILVSGYRHMSNYKLLRDTLVQYSPITKIIEGGARGADHMAYVYATEHKIPTKKYRANWRKHGTAAGPIRNSEMLRNENPDLVIAFLHPESIGTADLIRQASEKDIQLKVIQLTDKDCTI